MDIKLEIENKVFNYRVAVIIRNKDKILVQKDDRVSYFALLGGRCNLYETSIEAAIRETKEETGFDTRYVKSVGVIENFFDSSFNGKKYHEILIVHELEFSIDKYYDFDMIDNIEDSKKEHLKYMWMNIKDLKKCDFRPKVLLDILDCDSFQHIINRD